MVDVVDRRGDTAPVSRLLVPFQSLSSRSTPPATEQARDKAAPPRSDGGTVLIHTLTATAFLVSLFTGLRIAADAPGAVVSVWLSPILPQGEIWSWHFVAGLCLFFCGTAYLLFVRRSGLGARNSLKKTRVFVLPTARKLKYGALNVALHWFVYVLVVVLTVTGVLLYLGHGGWLVTVHSVAAFTSIGYLFAHILSHYAYGGWLQLLRVLRPMGLKITRATRPRPLLIGCVIGALTAAGLAAADWATRDTLTIARAEVPRIDGVLDDAVWMRIRPAVIRTQQGVNLGGTGESTVEVRAVHDGQKIYFAFRWWDPTRSLRRVPLIKKADGWHLLHDHADTADVNTFYEDKFSVLFSDHPSLGGAGSTSLGPRPFSGKPGALNDRGLHATTDGSYVDVWQWKAARGGLLGQVDDQYFGPLRDPSPAEVKRTARYQGGYWNDPGRAFYTYNYKSEPPGGYRGPVGVVKLPKDWRAMVASLGTFDIDPESNDDENARWWMTESETVPYSAEGDAAIPVGTVMPGVLISGNYEGDRAHIRGAARWKDGYWSLETSRDLRTGSIYDKDFVPGRDLYMWVAVFDHTQTRHTRHARPVRVIVEK